MNKSNNIYRFSYWVEMANAQAPYVHLKVAAVQIDEQKVQCTIENASVDDLTLIDDFKVLKQSLDRVALNHFNTPKFA